MQDEHRAELQSGDVFHQPFTLYINKDINICAERYYECMNISMIPLRQQGYSNYLYSQRNTTDALGVQYV